MSPSGLIAASESTRQFSNYLIWAGLGERNVTRSSGPAVVSPFEPLLSRGIVIEITSTTGSQVAVNDPLEVVQQPHGFLVYKWEILHQDHGAPTPCRVDPIEGVEESRPSKAACGSTAGVRIGVDQETESPFFCAARLDVDIGRCVWLEAFHFASGQLTDLIGHHALHRLGLEDPHVVWSHAVVEDHLHESDIVGCGGVEAAATIECRRRGRH